MTPPSAGDDDRERVARRDAIRAMLPILVGIIPFGLVAGVAPVEAGLPTGWALAYSPIVFAGAAQLAIVDLLESGATLPIVVGTALVINLRLLLYGASLAPLIASAPRRDRFASAYLLTDQAYAITVTRYGAAPPHRGTPRERFAFYVAGAAFLWATWNVTVAVGVFTGDRLPEELPLDFAVPLVFLALLTPTVTDRPTVVAAVFAGTATVALAELGAGDVSLILGVCAGVVAGAIVDAGAARRSGGATPGAPA